MKRNLLILLPLLMLSASCKNDKMYVEYESSFTFAADEMYVYAGSHDKIDVKARRTQSYPETRYEGIFVVDEESTAVAGMHYIPQEPEKKYAVDVTVEMEYIFPANSTAEQSLDIPIIPENITEETILVLKSMSSGTFINDGIRHIDKIKIHLMPGTQPE